MARSFHARPRAQTGKFHQPKRSAITGGTRRRIHMFFKGVDLSEMH